MYLLAKNTASYTYKVINSALTPSSKDEAKVVLAPFVRDKAYRVVKDTLSTPSFRVKGFRSIDLLNSTTSSVIAKLRSVAKRVYSGVR